MAVRLFPVDPDLVIIGNGPSALILSYILHGNVPYYKSSNPHPDPILHSKLLKSPCLFDLDVHNLTSHFGASRLSYSTQALPINVLLDTLIRPLADTEPGVLGTCVEWRHEPAKVIRHVILGNTTRAGGQWADNPVEASWDIAALSYAEMVSLPGYSLEEHYKKVGIEQPADFHRPARRDIADYLAAYPGAVGISDSIRNGTVAQDITRTEYGFHIGSLDLRCRYLVLASGIFSHLLPARPELQPLLQLPDHSKDHEPPLLVVGSGFTAADIIISTLPRRKIIHIFKWSPEDRPSPLRACHADAYPDYAGVYRRMKLSAMRALGNNGVFSPAPAKRHKANPFFNPRDWDRLYEGLPNTYIKEVHVHGEYATVVLQGSDGRITTREVSNMQYVIGRRGSLEYLDEALQQEVLGGDTNGAQRVDRISGKSLWTKVEENLEVAPGVFVIGSLTGDSLIRFAFGGCLYAAREIALRRYPSQEKALSPTSTTNFSVLPTGHARTFQLSNGSADSLTKKKRRTASIEFEAMNSEIWRKSGWAGCVV
ncbi:hypothetical protein MMC30_005467 [Trapelia coarctata]|nr:hypothetical protein [Trapelia coarctata]